MNNKNISFILYGGIIICITVMLILFSGTLSDKDDEIQDVAVTDELFVPESVVKLTDENEKLRTTMEQYANDVLTLDTQLDEVKQQLDGANQKNEVFNTLSKAVHLINQRDKAGARAELEKLDINTMDENARILYEFIQKEID